MYTRICSVADARLEFDLTGAQNISSSRVLVSKESQEPLLGARLVFTASNYFTTRVFPFNVGEENTSARSSQRRADTERRRLSL